MLVTRIRYWILAILLCVYLAGVLILSAVTLHEPKNGSHAKSTELRIQSQFRTFEYGGLPGFRPPLRRSKIHWCATDLSYIPPERSNPVALVSFPGSGNTWLRYLLQQATGFFTGSIYKDYGLLKNGFPAEQISNGSVLVVKTHEWGYNARNHFAKAIILVRAPAHAIQAEFNRQSGGHIGFASPDRYKRNKGKFWQQFVTDKLEGWKQTNLDWLYNFTGPTHVIFYEQLVDNTCHTIKSVIAFLGLPLNQTLFECALERKEGIYRRKKRVLNFDPYTPEMHQKLEQVQKRVYDAIYNYASPD